MMAAGCQDVQVHDFFAHGVFAATGPIGDGGVLHFRPVRPRPLTTLHPPGTPHTPHTHPLAAHPS